MTDSIDRLKTPFLNPNFLSDLFIQISILSQSLCHSHPLPSSLPSLRERLVYHQRLTSLNTTSFSHHHHHHHRSSGGDAGDEVVNDEYDGEKEGGKNELDPSNPIGLREITMEILVDKSFPIYSTAVVALASIVRALDEVCISPSLPDRN